MQRIQSLLSDLAHKNWGGRSLMQEARLSGGLFKYLTKPLAHPWAKELSFTVGNTTYQILIPRKQLLYGAWTPVATTRLLPELVSEHETTTFKVLTQILADKPGAT